MRNLRFGLGLTGPMRGSSSGYSANVGANFNGTDGYLNALDVSGVTDGKAILFSGWVKLAGAVSGTDYIYRSTNGRVTIQVDSAERVAMLCSNSAGTLIISLRTTTVLTTGSWHHVTVGADTATSSSFVILDGSTVTNELVLTADGIIDFSDVTLACGATTVGGSLFVGCMQDMYLTNEFLDMTSAPNLAKVYGPGPVDLGADGSNVTGTAALIHQRNPAATFEVNGGSLGDFTRNGTIGNCADGPT